MSLSPTMRMFGTAINYGFGDVEETGILIAVNEILEDKRVRHIESFVKQHPEAMKNNFRRSSHTDQIIGLIVVFGETLSGADKIYRIHRARI